MRKLLKVQNISEEKNGVPTQIQNFQSGLKGIQKSNDRNNRIDGQVEPLNVG